MSDPRSYAGESGGAAYLLASARERLSVATDDLRLPERLRLSQWQRSLVAALCAKLVRQIEDELRSVLAQAFGGEEHEVLHAALSSAHVSIAEPALADFAAIASPPLVSALLLRAEEHRLSRAGGGERGLLLELAGDADQVTASEAMALLLAQSARFDRFQEPVMARTELKAEIQHRLVWTIAAVLRRYMIDHQQVDPALADEALTAAAGGVLAGYDEGESVESACLRLAGRLLHAGHLTDSLLANTLLEGSLPLFLASLSVRSGLDFSSTWEIVSEPSGRGVVLLLRAADIVRESVGPILLRLSEDEGMLALQLDLFDVTAAEEARRLLRLWRFDPGYRAAIARMAA